VISLSLYLKRPRPAASVKKHLFLSRLIIYGDDQPLGQECVITETISPIPIHFYDQSKLQFEKDLQIFHDNSFTVTILRLPMVYVESCKGNFPRHVVSAP